MLQTKRYLLSVLSIACPCLLGVIAMIANGISVGLWARNPAAIAVLSLITFFVIRHRLQEIPFKSKRMLCLSMLLLLLPFLHPGVDGVHRWISVSVVSLNMAMIVLPVAILAIHSLLEQNEIPFALLSTLCIAAVLFLQPDASQLTGFTAAMLLCLFGHPNRKALNPLAKAASVGALVCLTALSWRFPDSLPPVDYVDGIFAMLGSVSPALWLAGVFAMILVPVPLIAALHGRMRVWAVCIAAYEWAITLSTFFGHFPVPFMGYGLSSIIGYFIALIRLSAQDNRHP